LEVRGYGGRDELVSELIRLVASARRVLMEYSPGNAIPYVSRVDGGTLDLVRSLGIEVASSADALAAVVAAWDSADIASHERDAAVSFLADRVAAGEPVQGGEVDRVCRAVIDKAGYGKAFTHRTGHSLGWLGAHGDGVNIDDFETHDTRLLRPGASFSIEPGI